MQSDQGHSDWAGYQEALRAGELPAQPWEGAVHPVSDAKPVATEVVVLASLRSQGAMGPRLAPWLSWVSRAPFQSQLLP